MKNKLISITTDTRDGVKITFVELNAPDVTGVTVRSRIGVTSCDHYVSWFIRYPSEKTSDMLKRLSKKPKEFEKLTGRPYQLVLVENKANEMSRVYCVTDGIVTKDDLLLYTRGSVLEDA